MLSLSKDKRALKYPYLNPVFDRDDNGDWVELMSAGKRVKHVSLCNKKGSFMLLKKGK